MSVEARGSLSATAVLVLVLMAQGCTPPSAVRRTALIPAASLPARIGAPLAKREGRASFELSAIEPVPVPGTLVPAEEGDPGVLIPSIHLGGALYYGLSDLIELGVQLQYTSASWARPNVSGVLAFPDHTRNYLVSGGIGGRINVPLSDRDVPAWTLSILAEANLADVPEVVFAHVDGAPARTFQLDHERSELFLIPELAVALGVSVGHGFHTSAIVGVQTSVTNIGFDDLQNIDDETTEAFAVGYGGAGIDFRYDFLFLGGYFYLPFEGEDKIEFGPRFQVQAGYTF